MANGHATAEQGGTTLAEPRRLWQAPLFVVGLAALAAVWFLRPLLPTTPPQLLQRELTSLRSELAEPTADLAPLLARAQRAAEEAEHLGSHQGDAQFLLGSVHLRLGDEASDPARVVHYQAARAALELAEQLGVTPELNAQLIFRLGKAGFLAGADPAVSITRLAKTLDKADDRVEALQLLTQAYLALPEPDLNAALKVNEQLRQVPLVGEEVLAPARMQGGQILLRMGKTEEARRVLERVGAQAPAAARLRALRLRAESFQNEGKWAEAQPLWQQVLADPLLTTDRQRVLYLLGSCHAHQAQTREAASVWEECLRAGQGPEATAAALALAELRLTENLHEQAIEVLQSVAAPNNSASQNKDTLAELTAARQVFEKVIVACRQAQRYDLALQAVAHFRRLAPPGRAAVLQAETSAEWARARIELAKMASDGERRKVEEVARELYQAAAKAYAEAADAEAQPPRQADLLWLAAARAFDARDLPRTAQLLERFLPLNQVPERAGEGWFLLGQVRHEQGQEPGAVDAWRECLKHPTPFAYHARYHLALFAMKAGDFDEAEEALEKNLKLLRFDPNGEAQEKSLFALGHLQYQRKKFSMVARRLGEAVERFPEHPEALRARYQLADAYRALAAQENQNLLLNQYKTPESREHARREYRRLLQAAADQFSELSRLLEEAPRDTTGSLTKDEIILAPFSAAECRFNLGQYEDALAIYEALATRHADGLERLNALGGVVRCLAILGRNEQVPARLADIRAVLPKVDEKVRNDWEKWLAIAEGKPAGS